MISGDTCLGKFLASCITVMRIGRAGTLWKHNKTIETKRVTTVV